MKLAAGFALSGLLVGSLMAWLGYSVAAHALTVELGRRLAAVAATAAIGIDGERFSRLREPSQMASQDYLRIQVHLRAVARENAGIKLAFVYTMAPTDQQGIWRYVVDSLPSDNPDFSALGDTEDYRNTAEGQSIVRAVNGPTADSNVVPSDRWGPLLTGAAPIKDSLGRTRGVLALDASAAAVGEMQARVKYASLLGLGIGFLATTGLGWLFSTQASKPLKAMMQGIRAVGEGDYTRPVQISNRDEFGQLADVFNEMLLGIQQRDLYRHQFERYVSHQVAAKVLADPSQAFWQGERRVATILFADLRGFTTVAEQLAPEEVVGMLNDYLSVFVDAVFRHEGTLDKFIGDAVMAVFGAPVSLGNDAERAVRAALEMQAAILAVRARWVGRAALDVGIGINTGDVVIGNIGSDRRLEYAAIGDTVNVAARIENLTRTYEVGILISEATYEAVRDCFDCRKVDSVAVRGREQQVTLYEVIGPHDSGEGDGGISGGPERVPRPTVRPSMAPRGQPT